MYSQAVVDGRFTQLYREKPAVREAYPQGLPWYSVEESQAMTAQLFDAVDAKRVPLRPFTSEETRFMEVTVLRCWADFQYFGERFVYIDQEGHGLRPLFPLWESQKLVLAQMGRMEESHRRGHHPDGILVNVLKARQLGVSTLSEALLAHRLVTRSHVRGLSGADVEDQAGYLFRMVGRIFDQLPWFLKPDRLNFVKNREMAFSNDSYLKTAWGKSTRGALASIAGEGSKGAIGRGQTYSAVHISELATWDNPEQLDAALFPAIPVHPDALVVLESTAEHAQDWWHLHWLATQENVGRFSNVFIPWYAEPSKYSLPAPVDWMPSATTTTHAMKCERDAPRWLGRSYTLTRDQLYWYERTRAYYLKKNELYKFLKEYPADDQECFQYSGRAIFSFEQLEAIDAAGSKRPLLDVWRVEPAAEIAALRRDLPAPDDRRPPAPLAPRLGGAGAGPLAAALYPVPPGYGFQRVTAAELAELPNLRQGVLAIYEYPRPRGRRRYVISVDVGDGLGSDYTDIDVIRLATIDDPAEQVAKWSWNQLDTKAVAFIVDAIGRFYCDEEGIEALAAIETNNHGLAVQDLLQLHLGYSNFYIWEYADSGDPQKRYSTKIGWVTNARTRPLLIAAWYAAVTTFDPITSQPDFILNSPITRGELRHFITEGTIGEAEAARGQHDDAIMASAIGYYVAWRQAGGELEPIDEKRRRRAAAQAAALSTKTRIAPWRDLAVSAAEVDAFEEEDADDYREDGIGTGSSVSFYPVSSGRGTDSD